MTYKRNWASVVLAFIHATFLFIPLYVLVGSMMKLQGTNLLRFSLMGIGVIVPVAVSYLMLRKVKHLFMYVVLAALCTIFFLAIGAIYGDYFHYGNIVTGVLSGGISFIVFLIRGYAKIEHNQLKEEFYAVHDEKEPFLLEPWEMETFLSTPSVVHWGWFGILYVLALLCKYHYVLYEVFILFVIDIFICFACIYSDAFFEYLKMNHRVASMPLSSMRKVHRQIFVIGMFLIVLFILPAVIYHKEPLENVSLKNRSPIEIDMVSQQANYEMVHVEQSTELDLLLADYDVKPTPKWVKYLLNGILALIGTSVAVGVVLAIVQKIGAVAKSYQLEDEDEVINLDYVGEERQYIKGKNFMKDRLSEKAKIRRRYRKVIRSRTQGKPKKSSTPTELELEARMAESLEYEGLHEEYEKVRYGKE